MLTSFFKTKKHLKEAKKKEDDFPSFKSKSSPENPLLIRNKNKIQFKDSQIKKIVLQDVIEVTFKRRIWPIKIQAPWQKKEHRRMLCTSNWKYLKSDKQFKWVAPRGIRPRSKAWYKKRNLIIVWDLILRNWRMISLDDYTLVNVYQTHTKEQQTNFSRYYKNLMKKGRNKLKEFYNK
jgi:hypothetical protein